LGDAPKFLPRKHGFDEFYGILYSNDMWPKHPQQGTVFNFPDISLYENETPLRVLEDQTFLTAALTEKAIGFIKKNKTTPFFVYLPHPQPHVPLFAAGAFQNTQARGLYGDVISEIDNSVGQILKTLKEEGLDENTIVIFTSDNGPWLSYGGHSGSPGIFREGKGTNWEGGHRVPGIVRYPKAIQPNTRIDAPAMGIDWLPTLAEFTGSNLPQKKIDGASLVPLLTGKTVQSPHDNFFFYYRTNELHAVRHKDWKLYVPHTYRSLNGRQGTNDGFPVPYDMNEISEAELYDLSQDPEEQVNLAVAHPEWVDKITKIADSVRGVLGDRLTGVKGSEVRPVGRID
jgi:arylsulfatase